MSSPTVTIYQRFTALNTYLQAGVFNLTQPELQIAQTAAQDLVNNIPLVQVPFYIQDAQYGLLNQAKIINRQLLELIKPTFINTIYVSNTDCYTLALQYLGDALLWQQIAALNQINDPYIEEVTPIQIPALPPG